MIDLRSDTVTKPVPEMREAMAQAEVGDDVYREDPTVNGLEEKVADLFGKESSLFVPSGSMGNQIAVNIHTRPGDEVILDSGSHIFNYEMGTMATFSGVLAHSIETEEVFLPIERVKGAIKPKKYYVSRTGLISLENTHNTKGGVVYPPERAEELIDFAEDEEIPVHLDGARVFNASVATGLPVDELTRGFDSVMFCLSKGLGAPVGSMLVGSEEFIEGARRVRKRLGGGMRQIGILAAAGIYALENHVDRLKEDHRNAKLLAELLSDLEEIELETPEPETNMVIFELKGSGPSGTDFVEDLRRRNVLVGMVAPRKVRLVTHLDVGRDEVEKAGEIIRSVLKNG